MGYMAGQKKLEVDKIITKEEYQKLLKAAKKMELEGYLLVLFGGNLGTRGGEVILLCPSDFRLEECIVTVPTLKKRGSNPPRLSVHVSRAFCNRFVEILSNGIFEPSKRFIHKSPRWVRWKFQQIKALADIRRPISYHALRHYFGTKCYQATRDLVFTQMQMRHASLLTVQKYQHVVESRERAESLGFEDVET